MREPRYETSGNGSAFALCILFTCRLSNRSCIHSEFSVCLCSPCAASQYRWPSCYGFGGLCSVTSKFCAGTVEFLRHNIHGGLLLQTFEFFPRVNVYSHGRLPEFDRRLVRRRLRSIPFGPRLELQNGRYRGHLGQWS